MKNQINLAIQVLPRSTSKHPYAIVDEAIEIIKNSGVKFVVCPFETVMEGDYDQLMAIVKRIHEICYASGADEMICNIKIQTSSVKDVTLDDKMEKYW